jgi:ubiquinone/menaquinone biosynthesis C-methylase UbiE
MIKIRHLVIISSIALGSCHGPEEQTVMPDSGMMTREQTPKATTVSDDWQNKQPSAGNFEVLVSDYESKQRAIWQKPDMVIALMGDLTGKTVADIGAGTGYFTFRLVPKAQKVIGIDIDQRFISFMDSVKVRLPETYQNRFESRLGQPDDPRLKPSEADAVMIVNTYGYIDHREKYLKTLAKGMKENARLLIIDFKKNNLPVGPPTEFKVSVDQVKNELEAAGFSVQKADIQSLDYQYIIIASLQKEAQASH